MTVPPQAGTTLRPPSERVSRRAPLFWTVRAGAGWAALLVAETVLLFGTPLHHTAPGRPVWPAVTVTIAAAHLVVMPRWRHRVHRWEAAPLAVYAQNGWFHQERRIVPVSRIQTVDVRRGPLHSLFGLADVTVTTASARGPVHLHALDHEVADRLVEDLSRRIRETTGDAT
ncbi:PH domain-containing protein [Streptomyces sp. CA-181903]|uniref:PH domain-containing protein n=1 Tax=Streptomyces sp. CA-181903 TaxID=3240055 RepID=UPI003D91B622